MIAITLVTLALSAFSTAAPVASICGQPTSFNIIGFSKFTATDATSPSSISFTFSDNSQNSTSIQCSYDSATATGPLSQCADGLTEFEFSGNTLTVGETYTSCTDSTQSAQTFGDLSLALNCYAVIPPFPLGAGTLCQTPTAWVGGFFTRATLEA